MGWPGWMSYDRRIHMSTLRSQFGQIDIYLFDQLLRGRIVPGMRIFDAGCGSGRNLVDLLRAGYDAHFASMLHGTWRSLRAGGLFFCRLASSIGIEDQVERMAGQRFLLPDRSERYLVNEGRLLELTNELGGHLLDPLKTTIVQ